MRICVFCGSSSGHDPAYAGAAATAARSIALNGAGLVYGGGRVGLMGIVADTALGAGGEVIGVMPRSLVEREIGHRGLTRLQVVETMHERKTTMSALADAFLALPGGAGTLETVDEPRIDLDELWMNDALRRNSASNSSSIELGRGVERRNGVGRPQ
jgi:uncharacterized protein (TIGR00730 family)